jgi:hypothetical protein
VYNAYKIKANTVWKYIKKALSGFFWKEKAICSSPIVRRLDVTKSHDLGQEIRHRLDAGDCKIVKITDYPLR